MQEARFQVRYKGKLGTWEGIPFIAVMLAESESLLVGKIADGMARVPGVHEVRLSFAGSQQGYYYRGGK